MKITFAPKGMLQIDDARIIFRNFSGKASKFNREGDRSFALVIPDEDLAQRLVDEGWNVRVKPAPDPNDVPRMNLPVKIRFNERGPAIYLQAGKERVRLSESQVAMLDRVDILSVDLDIRPYNWEVNGKTGRSAYLQSMLVIQNEDRFARTERMAELTEEVPF